LTVTPASGVSSIDRPLPLTSRITAPEIVAERSERRSSVSRVQVERDERLRFIFGFSKGVKGGVTRL